LIDGRVDLAVDSDLLGNPDFEYHSASDLGGSAVGFVRRETGGEMCDITTIPFAGIREPVGSLSHFVGAFVFAVLAFLLVRRGRGDTLRMISLALMGYASIQTLTISSVYHMFWPGPCREIMLRVDVAGIFFLIAGCITPVHMILFSGPERWAPVIVAWGTAVGGAILRTMYFDQLPAAAGVAIFLIFGWGGAVTAFVLWRRYGWYFIQYAVMGGLAYTAGAIILMVRPPMLIEGVVGPHELWHLAVLAGLGMHWRFVFQIASGENRAVLQPVTIPIRSAAASITRDAA
jgi:channel protein (hemolysin III family)